MASTSLTRPPSSNGSTTINTWSFWVKRTDLNDYETLYSSEISSSNVFKIGFTLNALEILFYVAPSYVFQIKTNRLFRDTSAWYHIVVTQNAGAATNTDRLKIYVNGVQETSFAIANFPDLNEGAAPINASGVLQNIGTTATEYFGGSMSHIHLCDGTAYDATEFGEYDANGVWKIKTDVSVTYGTNGFFILKDGNSVTDQSGNSNNWTVAGGTLTKTEDSPSNVFATWNKIDGKTSSSTFSNGNLKTVSAANSPNICGTSTLGASQGKYYYEIKLTTEAVSGEAFMGVGGDMETNIDSDPRNEVPYYAIRNQGGIIQTGVSQSTSQHPNFSAGDIIGFGLDLDNNRLYISKNGSWWDSTTTFSGSTPTNYITLGTGFSHWRVMVANVGGASSQETYEANFGNGYFGTTAVSTPGTNASGNGIFEFDVPTGYTALSTKGLNL